MKIRKGDMVQIISGADKGKSGRVIKVFLDKERIVVEGVHMVKKHTRPCLLYTSPSPRDS